MNVVFMEIIRIPAERVSVLLGKAGKTKKLIEKKCGVAISVDEEGEVQIDGDPSAAFFTRDVVQAIGRGFGSQDAMRLAEPDYNLFVFHLRDMISGDKAITRLRGRVIGEAGKTKTEIESAAECWISVYGYTISIIAAMDTMEYAKEAVQMLLDGAPHATVYQYLHKARRLILKSRLK